MTPDRNEEAPDENVEHGVLDDIGTLDTASISILGGHTAQVSLDLPPVSDDDADDDVIEDELPIDEGLVPELRSLEPADAAPAPGVSGSDDGDAAADASREPETTSPVETPLDEVATGDIILEPHGSDVADESPSSDVAAPDVHDAEIVTDEALADAPVAAAETDVETPDDDTPLLDAAAPTAGSSAEVSVADDDRPVDEGTSPTPPPVATRSDVAASGDEVERSEDENSVVVDAVAGPTRSVAATSSAASEPRREEPSTDPDATEALAPLDAAPIPHPGRAETPRPVDAESTPGPGAAEQPTSGATEQNPPLTRSARAVTGAIGTVPLTRREVHHADDAARMGRAHAVERVRTAAPEVSLTSKRLGELDDTRESPDLLTADRLLDPRQIERPEPEGAWQHLVYAVSRHRINLGDGRRARQRKELDRRIAAPLPGEARFVPVLSRKGGVGKTTITSLLGMALADAREDRVIAVDANPDRGTLADRVGRPNGRTVRDLVRAHDDVAGYSDISSIVARDATRLDVLASDSDPRVSEAFNDEDYRQVADVAAHYYSLVLTDTGTGVVHSVMEATLERASALVIVAGLSVDEARLASETLTWLETNGYADRVRDAVVVLNSARPGAPLVRESELDAHFRSRVRAVIRMPYDPHIAAGSTIAFRDLRPATRNAARELAAAVVEGLRARAVAA